MSDYKHGDWFCKPADKEEAEEIIERAVASGAELHDTTDLNSDYSYRWNLYYAWGVYLGKTHSGDIGRRDTFEDVKKYTIDQRRELFPLPSERVTNSYTHGDWYCKPASEAEAREIIERAVVSGASNPTGWRGNGDVENDRYGHYGVLLGRVIYGSEGEWVNAKKYTLAQLRELFPLPDEQVTKWNGEGWPPLGAVYEVEDADHGWIEGVALFYDRTEGHAVFKTEYGYSGYSTVRRIQSEREQWIEQAERAIEARTTSAANSAHIGLIYDAIKSGELKAPEAANEHVLRD